MGFGFPTNLLISEKSLPKIFVVETEETVSESVCSSETISFPLFENSASCISRSTFSFNL